MTLHKGILRQIQWCTMLSLCTQRQPWHKFFPLCTRHDWYKIFPLGIKAIFAILGQSMYDPPLLAGASRCSKATKLVIIWMHNAEANQDMKLTGKSYHNYTLPDYMHKYTPTLAYLLAFFAMPNSTEAEVPHHVHRFEWQ